MKSLLILAALMLSSHVVICWNQTDRTYILDMHNEMRRKQNACEMNKLVYDMDLEGEAKEWATECDYKHSSKQRGENLAFNTNKYTQRVLVTDAMNSFYDEIKLYNYGQHSCGPNACHYTQIVWAETTRVGCYTHQCPYLHTMNVADAWYLVCIYQDKGNWDGDQPFKKMGSCTSHQCQANQTIENGLCVGQPECKDKNEQCEGWAKNNECSKNPNYMLRECKKSCNNCPKAACVDQNEQCEQWAREDHCKKSHGYMEKNCRKSCNKCD